MAIYDVNGNVVIDTKEEFQGIDTAFAIKKNFTGSASASGNLTTLPTIVHVSDVHGDAKRFQRACVAAKRLGADALANTGDIVYYYSTDNYSYVVDALNGSGITYVQCIGNHDAMGYATEQEVYTKFVAPWADSVTLPQGVDYPTYYYKDISDKKLRIISVNQYQAVASDNTSHDTMHFHQEQITWLVETLLDTPQDFGVLILLHSPEQKPSRNSIYKKFFQKDQPVYFSSRYKPITEIVDAFISGGTLTKTYENGSGYTPASFTVDADFSSKNSGVEFIAYLSGHLHYDCVTYVQNATNTQLLLDITCGNVWLNKTKSGGDGTTYPQFNESNDLAKVDGELCQDSVNVYVIDRANKMVRIARIGACMPYDCDDPRDCMLIPYAAT